MFVITPHREGHASLRVGHGHEEVKGTDLTAVAEGRVAITPLHFDLTSVDALSTLETVDLSELLPT